MFLNISGRILNYSIIFIVVSVFSICWGNDFAYSFYRQIATTNENVLISPYSTSYAFAIVYIGSQGLTSDEIANAFNFNQNKYQFDSIFGLTLEKLNKKNGNKKDLELSCIASLWSEKDHIEIDSEFIYRAKSVLNVEIYPIQFAKTIPAIGMINRWVSYYTNGKINKIMSPSDITPPPSLVLTSAIYFNSKWKNAFPRSSTQKMPFYQSNLKEVQVKMMHQEFTCRYYENKLIQIVELNYLDTDISMFVILPKKRYGLAEIRKTITNDSMKIWTNNLQFKMTSIFLPQFTVTTQRVLNPYLMNLGIHKAFKSGAEFSGISKTPNSFYINKAIQKAIIEVNEDGTLATSVDVIDDMILGMDIPPPVLVFNADHPFLYVIRENTTGVILFIGDVQTHSIK